MFRRVELTARVRGRLLLHSLPGRYEAIERVWHEVRNEAVHAIVCLAESHEIRQKSIEYAAALETGTVPCSVLSFAIPEGGAPENRDAFWALANDVAQRLEAGENVLIHCVGGVGRTAMLAITVLLALGAPAAEARRAVSSAGSMLETASQGQVISWCAAQANRKS